MTAHAERSETSQDTFATHAAPGLLIESFGGIFARAVLGFFASLRMTQ
jgi:hypothetical protein